MFCTPAIHRMIACVLMALFPSALISQSGPVKNQVKTIDSLIEKDAYCQAAELLEEMRSHNAHTLPPEIETWISYQLGMCYTHLGRETQAVPFFDKILQEPALVDSILLSDTHAGYGICLEYTGKHDSAFFHYLQSLHYAEPLSDTMRMARGLRNMAQLLRVREQYEEARHYFRRVLDLSGGIRDYKLLANIYNETGFLFELSGLLDSARHYYTKLIDISRNNNYRKGESVGYANLATIYDKESNPGKALDLKYKAIRIDTEIGDTYGLMTSYAGLKESYLLLDQPDSAVWALQKALSLCDTAWLVDLGGIYKGLYEVYKHAGNHGEALSAFEQYVVLDRRTNAQEIKEKISEMLLEFETEQKEQKIRMLEEANIIRSNKIRLQWLLLGSLILVSLSGLVAGLLALKNKNQRLLQMESELRHMQLLEEKSGYQANDLTGREQEIMHFLARGCSYEIIAEKLFISKNTVKYHIKNIYLKLDVKNRVEALLKCNDQ